MIGWLVGWLVGCCWDSLNIPFFNTLFRDCGKYVYDSCGWVLQGYLFVFGCAYSLFIMNGL